jgi:tetratricopeptide (TPR) repeat protein
LIESGDILQDEASSRWQATEEVSSISIPDTLHGVLMARIDRLHEEARRVLQLAAVIGRIFLYRILAAISEEERELDEQLTALQREEMIRERARLPELEYIFKHHLTQEAAYSGLLRRERRRFHRQVAEALERLFPDRIEEQLGLLAHHFTQAEAWEKAFHYLARSGHRARRAYANHEAIAYYTQALEVSGRISPPMDEEQLLPVYEGRGVVFMLLSRQDEAIADFQMMRQMARASGNQQKEGESLFHLGEAHHWKQSDEEIPIREQYGQEAVRLAQLTGDQRTAAGSLTSLAQVDRTRGELQEANRKLEESLQISRREGYMDFVSEDLTWLSAHAYWQGDYERGIPHCQEGLAVARDFHHGFAELHNLAFLCLHQASLGNYGEALNAIREGMTKARERDNKLFVGRLTNTLGWFHCLLNDFSRAAEYDQESAELGRTYGQPNVEISALINLGADYVGLGQYKRARSHLEAMLERIEIEAFGSHKWFWKVKLHNVLAEACHATGDHEEALRCLEESLSVAVANSVQKYMAKGWALRGRILAHLGNAEAAGADLQRAFALAEQLNSPSITYPIAFDLGQWHEGAGQEREAAELYGKAKATVERMATAVEDETLRSVFLQSAPVQAIYESFARIG